MLGSDNGCVDRAMLDRPMCSLRTKGYRREEGRSRRPGGIRLSPPLALGVAANRATMVTLTGAEHR
jgi:hypothetical protein